ncbi:cell filamentation protein Fic [Salmonella enterica]|nr:cell filamentation protein Fic [Salmonella enterica]
MTSTEQSNAPLGFSWDRSVIEAPETIPTRFALAIWQQHMTGFIWDAAQLEGNAYTFVQIKTLLDGVTVGGHKVSDTEQILNLRDASTHLTELIRRDQFDLSKDVFTTLNSLIARNEALEWGIFRGEGEMLNYNARVHLGEQGVYEAPETLPGAPVLNAIFEEGSQHIKSLPPFEGALAFFLFGALQQFFFDGNKRTSRYMMNGWLMKHGYGPISIPASSAERFNELMVDFYLNRDGTKMMAFLTDFTRKGALTR